MDVTAHKALVKRYVELWNTGNLALAEEVLAADFVDHSHPEFVPGPASVQQAVAEFRRGFPDAQVTIEQIIGEGDIVAFQATIRGTHLGPFGSFAPTGKEAILRGMDFIRIAQGKIVELWSCQDTLSWILQLGAKLQ